MCRYIVSLCLVNIDFYIYIHHLEGRYLYYAKESLLSLFSLWQTAMIIVLNQSKISHDKAVQRNGL